MNVFIENGAEFIPRFKPIFQLILYFRCFFIFIIFNNSQNCVKVLHRPTRNKDFEALNASNCASPIKRVVTSETFTVRLLFQKLLNEYGKRTL